MPILSLSLSLIPTNRVTVCMCVREREEVCVMAKKEQFFCACWLLFFIAFAFFYYVGRWVEEQEWVFFFFFFSRINLTKTKETIFFVSLFVWSKGIRGLKNRFLNIFSKSGSEIHW